MDLYSMNQGQLIDYVNGLLSQTIYRIICDTGNFWLTIKKNAEDIFISDFLLFPVEEVCEEMLDDSQYKIEVAILKDGQLSLPQKVTVGEIYNYKKWPTFWGFRRVGLVSSYKAQILNDVLDKILRHYPLPTKSLYCYTGWNRQNTAFLLGNLKIEKEAVTQVEHSKMKNVFFDESLSEKTALEFISAHYFKVLKQGFYTQILLSYTILALLFSRIRASCCTCVNFAIYIEAPYSSGKTSTIAALTNPWGAETLSFEDTSALLTDSLKECRDIPVLVDDMSKSTRDGMVSKAERIARLVGDPGTAARKMKGNKPSSENISCLAIISGEQVPPLQASSYVRLMFLTLYRDSVNWQELTIMQENKVLLTTFWVRFLQFLMRQEHLTEKLDKSFVQFRSEVLDRFRQQSMSNRYAEMYGWMMSAWALLTEYSASLDIEIPSQNFGEELKTMLIAQNIKYGIKSPAEMFLNAFFALMETEQLTVVSYDEAKDGKPFDAISWKCEWYVRSKLVYNKIIDYYAKLNVDFPYSERAIRKDLFEKELLKDPRNAKHTLTAEFKTRTDKSIFCFVLYKNNCTNFINERNSCYDEIES